MALAVGFSTDLQLEAQEAAAGLAALGCSTRYLTVSEPLVAPSLDIAALASVYSALCIPVQTTALTPGFWHGRRRLWLSRPIEKLLF